MPPNVEFSKQQAIPSEATYNVSQIAGKSVIITGGASGIGEATMRAFVEAGAFVTFGDIAEERAQKLVNELGNDKVAFVHCDVLSWADQLKLFKTALEKSPSKTIDVVIANAGLNRQDEVFVQKESEDGDPIKPSLDILQINLVGAMYTAKLAMFYLPKQPEGQSRDRCLLMTASLAAYVDLTVSPQYSASKWGIRGLMHSLRRGGPSRGIRVNVVAPWFIDTLVMPQEVKDRITSMGIQWAKVADAAAAFLHLASDNSINGRSVTIVPESVHKRGYYDLEEDDFVPGTTLSDWQNLVSGDQYRQ